MPPSMRSSIQTLYTIFEPSTPSSLHTSLPTWEPDGVQEGDLIKAVPKDRDAFEAQKVHEVREEVELLVSGDAW